MCPYTLPAADRNQPCSQSPAPLPHKCTHAPACSRGHTHPCRRHQQASAQPHIPCARGHESLTQAHTLHTFPCGHNQGRGPAGLPRSAVPMAAAGVRPERCVPRRRAWQTLRQRPHIKHTLTHARLSATIHRTRCVYIHTYQFIKKCNRWTDYLGHLLQMCPGLWHFSSPSYTICTRRALANIN